MPKSEAIAEYESLDILHCQATAFAESKCRKLRRSQVAFSPEVNDSRRKIGAWILLASKAKGKKVSSRLLSRMLHKASLTPETRSLTKNEVQKQLKEEYKNYYSIKGEAQQLRLSALESLAKAIAEKGNTERGNIIKALRERKHQRNTAKKYHTLERS